MSPTALSESMDALTELAKLAPGMKPQIAIYTDGACSGNPGPGGWGAVVEYAALSTDLMGGEPQTTNNRMEMMGAIGALEALPLCCQIDLYTDSKYLRDGVTQWMHNWKRNGWQTADKKPVKNKDLWLALDVLLTKHQISWHWVKGHAGHPQNERADALARNGIISQKMNML